MPKTSKQPIDKAELITATAEELFLREGYGVTSMDRIAAVAGVTKQTVYRYFPSKEALFASVMERTRATEITPHPFDTNTELAQELYTFGVRFLHFHLQPKVLGLYRLMLTEGAQQQSLSTVFMHTGPQGFIKPLTSYLLSQTPLKENEAEFTARMFCTMILAPRNGLLMGHQKTLSLSSQETHVHQVVALILPALRRDNASPR